MSIFSNNAESTLSVAVSDTALQIAVVDASNFNIDADPIDSQIVTIVDGINVEICEITGITGNIMTIVRAIEDTTALSFPIGAKVFAGITAGVLSDLTDNIAALINNASLVDSDILANTDAITVNANAITVLGSQLALPVLEVSGDPNTVPQFAHQWYRDSNTHAMWRSTGTTNATDWDKYMTTNRYLRYGQIPASPHTAIPLGRMNIHDDRIEFKSRTTDGFYMVLCEGFVGGAAVGIDILPEDDGARYNIEMQNNYKTIEAEVFEGVNLNIVFIRAATLGVHTLRFIADYKTDSTGLGLFPTFHTAMTTNGTMTARSPTGTPPTLGNRGILEVTFYGILVTMKWLDGIQ